MSLTKRLMEPLQKRVMLMIAKAIVTMVDDTEGFQTLQITILKGETRNNVRRSQNYGMSSFPQGDVRAIAVAFGGNRDHPMVISVDVPKARPRNLKKGEVIVYDDLGQSVHLTRDGIVVNGAGKPITIINTPKVRADTPMFECTGEIKDRCDTDGVTMSGMRSVYDVHDHPGDSGGTTGDVNQKMNP